MTSKDQRLRLACIIGRMQAGGAERVMAQLCNHFAAQNIDTTLVTFASPSEAPFYPVSESVRLLQIGTDRDKRSRSRAVRATSLLKTLRSELRAIRPDAVISFIDMANVLTLVATRGLGLPIIVSERVDPRAYSQRLPAAGRMLRPMMYRYADRVVVQTKRAANYFDRFPRLRIVTIANPVPTAKLISQPDCPFADGRYRIIAVGRLDHQKGFDLLIDSFAQLAGRFPKWDVAIFGQGAEHATLLAGIEHHGLGNRIRLMGVSKEIAAEMAQSHIMALPSRYEGFPNALSEAMAAGLPAIAFEDVSGVEDLIDPGVSGLLASWGTSPPDSAVQSLTEGLDELMQSADLRVKLGARASCRVQDFRPELILAQWENLIDAVVRENSANRRKGMSGYR